MIRTLLALYAASTLAACAAPAPATSPSPTRKAEESRDPALPVAAFIDSAALHQALLTAPPAPPEFPRKSVFVVRYDSTGALLRVYSVFSRFSPEEYGLTMSTLLRAHVKPRLPVARESVQMVWLQSGATPVIAVLGSDIVEVPPEMSNRSMVARELEGAVQRLLRGRPDLAGRQVTGLVSMRVTEEGLPTNSLLRLSTGTADIDREIIAVARSMRFSPARLGEHPVPVLVTLPVSLVFPAPPAQPATGQRP